MLRLLLLLLLLPVFLSAQVSFEPGGGIYPEVAKVAIEAPESWRIFYTLDGSRPHEQSLSYQPTERLVFFQTTVLRVLAIDGQGEAVFLGGASYLVGEPPSELAIISVGIDSRRLFDPFRGWFVAGPRADDSHWKMKGANFWTHDEYPGHLDLYEPDGQAMFSGQVGYRLFGGMSRLHPQKSLSVSCRKDYGQKRINYPVFGKEEQDSYKFLVFRNGGSDWSRSHFRDALMSSLLEDRNWDLDHQASRPALLYINGKYWGLYHIREKINRVFVADHRGYDKDSLDLLEHRKTVKAGNDREWEKTLLFLQKHRYFGVQEMRAVNEMIDVDNFMRLQIAQNYFDNRDAGGNIRYYRPWQPDELGQQRWRWILYDLDYGFGVHDPDAFSANTLQLLTAKDGPAWPNPPWSTLLQRRLLTNAGYRANFVNRSLDYLQTDFSAARVSRAIDRHASRLRPEMPRALSRWKLTMANWETHVDRLHEFAAKRPAHVREQLRAYYSGGPDRLVTIRQNQGGTVVMNQNIVISKAEWTGHYFANFPIALTAKPLPGYRFAGWQGVPAEHVKRPAIELELSTEKARTVTASFKAVLHPDADRIVINEVAASTDLTGGWIELVNRTNKTVQLRDWFFNWETTEIRLPACRIRAGEYLLLAADIKQMAEKNPVMAETAVSFPGLKKLKNIPAAMGLYAARGAFVDRAVFPPSAGERLALAAIHLDNSKPGNWLLQLNEASPGGENTVGVMSLHIRYGGLWERFALALVLIGVGWRWWSRRRRRAY